MRTVIKCGGRKEGYADGVHYEINVIQIHMLNRDSIRKGRIIETGIYRQ